PSCRPTLPPVMLMKAGALQPDFVRQLTTPLPCLPPTIAPIFVMAGITATHSAFATMELGTCCVAVILRMASAAPSSSLVAVLAATVPLNKASMNTKASRFIDSPRPWPSADEMTTTLSGVGSELSARPAAKPKSTTTDTREHEGEHEGNPLCPLFEVSISLRG